MGYYFILYLILSYLILYFGYSNITIFIPLSPRNLQTSLTLCSLRLAAYPCDTNIIFCHPLYFLLHLLHPVTTSLLSLSPFLSPFIPTFPSCLHYIHFLSLSSFLPPLPLLPPFPSLPLSHNPFSSSLPSTIPFSIFPSLSSLTFDSVFR